MYSEGEMCVSESVGRDSGMWRERRWTGRLQCGWRGRRYEERSVSMFVCVLRERCSLGLSGGVCVCSV